jgi:hypothetical protein
MKIHIELEIPPAVKRAALLAAGTSVLLFGGAVAYGQTAATSSDTLIGSALNTLGTAVSILQAQVAQLQAADHVNRATLATTGAVLTQNGRWLARVDHPTSGFYTLRFASDAFTAAPTCVATAVASDVLVPAALANPSLSVASLACTPATTTSVTCETKFDRVGGVDTGLTVICSGQ